MKSTIGFVGLGLMGEPMCRHLLEREYKVHLYDVSQEALLRFRGTAAQPASTLRELAESVDVVVLMLPNSRIVEQVVLGDDGLAQWLSAGKVLIDMSSSQPSSTRHIAGILEARGVQMLDSPVSGGVLRAREGTLAMMVGGERQIFEQQLELLQSFGRQIFYIGGHGTGHLTKALNNLLSATTLASAAEVVLLGIRAGLDPAVLIEVVNASTGRSNSTEVKFPRFILTRTFDDGFALALMSKDLNTALGVAEELDFPLPIGSVVNQLWQAALNQGLGKEGHTTIYTFLENLTQHRQEEDA